MGRAQNQTRMRQGDPFAHVMPGRRGIKNEGLLAQVPNHHERDQLASLVRELHAGRFQQALQVLQKHSGQDAPLLRELHEEALDALVHSQGVRKMRAWSVDGYLNVFGEDAIREHVAMTSTYLTILGLQREYEEEACMLDTEKDVSQLESWSPAAYDKRAATVHLRPGGQVLTLCHETVRVDGKPLPAMRTVPYVFSRRAVYNHNGKLHICHSCLGLAHRVEGPHEETVAWLNERREHQAAEEIRAHTDLVLRERLGKRAPITQAAGLKLAAKGYETGVLGQAAHILRSDRSAFEELCFTPEQKEWIARLEKGARCPLQEVLSEEQWLKILVRDFPASMEAALVSGVVHHRHGDAALFMIEKALSDSGELPARDAA